MSGLQDASLQRNATEPNCSVARLSQSYFHHNYHSECQEYFFLRIKVVLIFFYLYSLL